MNTTPTFFISTYSTPITSPKHTNYHRHHFNPSIDARGNILVHNTYDGLSSSYSPSQIKGVYIINEIYRVNN